MEHRVLTISTAENKKLNIEFSSSQAFFWRQKKHCEESLDSILPSLATFPKSNQACIGNKSERTRRKKGKINLTILMDEKLSVWWSWENFSCFLFLGLLKFKNFLKKYSIKYPNSIFPSNILPTKKYLVNFSPIKHLQNFPQKLYHEFWITIYNYVFASRLFKLRVGNNQLLWILKL